MTMRRLLELAGLLIFVGVAAYKLAGMSRDDYDIWYDEHV